MAQVTAISILPAHVCECELHELLPLSYTYTKGIWACPIYTAYVTIKGGVIAQVANIIPTSN